MNTVHIAGHLGADPETRFTQSGRKVTTLRVASRTRKGGNDDTIWWKVTLWGDQYDKMIPHLKKGSAVMVVGEFQKPDLYNDREGKTQISLEITALHIGFSPFGRPAGQEQKGGQETYSGVAPFGKTPEAPNPYTSPQVKEEPVDEEIPF